MAVADAVLGSSPCECQGSAIGFLVGVVTSEIKMMHAYLTAVLMVRKADSARPTRLLGPPSLG